MPHEFIKDIIDLPEQVNRGDFVLRLSEGVQDPVQTIANYVVTPQLAASFDQALAIIKSGLDGGSSKAAYLHGSFGSGKSHFMAVLHLILQGNVAAKSISELAPVIAKHNSWLGGRKFLLVPFHLIGAKSLDSAVLGGYVRHLQAVHPGAATPPVYRSEQLLRDSDALRERMGDTEFFKALNAKGARADDAQGWGEVNSLWERASYEEARAASPATSERRQLVGDLIDTFFTSMRQTDEFVSLDDGLAIISGHAKSLGYDALILFLDELILWLASHAADLNFIATEAQKVPKLVESERGDRPVPIISFVARQRDLRELVGQHITGAERLSFSDVLSYWEGRFGLIKLEDRNLPIIAEKRILRPKSAEAKAVLDREFQRSASVREEVMRVLLTSTGNREDFRKLYPFSPALVETLVAVSSLLQRERTALKIMLQLLVKQKETLRVGQIVPVGDLYDEIAQGDEAFSADMKAHFDNARKLYQQHLRPLLEHEHGLSFDDADGMSGSDTRKRGLINDDRLMKTLLLAALAPGVESLKGLTPARLAALNHGTITTPIAGQEATTVLNKCKKWAAAVGQIKVQESAGSQPTIQLQISGVDVQSIVDQAEAVDNHGNRIRKLKEMLFADIGTEGEQELFARMSFRWRGTDRQCDILLSNVREVPEETLVGGANWRIIIDYPFDVGGHSVRDDLAKLERFRESGKSARTICWLPSFLNHRAMEQLGKLVRLDHILTENRFPTFVTHLSDVDRASARAQLENQRESLRSQLKAQCEMAYGLRGGGQEYLDASNVLEGADHFQSLDPALDLQPPAASNFNEGLRLLLDQALRSQFPAHPAFNDDMALTRSVVEKVFHVVQEAVRTTEPSVFVSDMPTRKHMLRIASPLNLGQMGENRFQIASHWKQHFDRLLHQQGVGQPLTAQALRRWIDEPRPMGLPALLQDLIIFTFAEQTNRSFVLYGTTVEPQFGGLNEETILRETPLPDEPIWEKARTRAKSIFGFDVSPLRNSTNVAQLAQRIRDILTNSRPSVRSLPKTLQGTLGTLNLPSEQCPRLNTAQAAEMLLNKLGDAKDDRDLVVRLGDSQLSVSEAALAASIMQAAPIDVTLKDAEWQVFSAIITVSDDRQPAAQNVWARLCETLRTDEHAMALVPRLRTLRTEAIDLLAAARLIVATPAPTPATVLPPVTAAKPQPESVRCFTCAESDYAEVVAFYSNDREKIERNRQLVRELKALYGASQIEADMLPSWISSEVARLVLEVHHIVPLSQGGADERSNMVVLTPTLHALVHLDNGCKIDLLKGRLELPAFGISVSIKVDGKHNG